MRREMKQKKGFLFAIVFSLVMFVSTVFGYTSMRIDAASVLLPNSYYNLDMYLIEKSYMTATSTGYARVYYDESRVCIENYDNNLNITGKKYIDMELPVWGGFYAGSDAYYLVEGKHNIEENDSAEVMRIIKYDRNWKRLGDASITSEIGVRYIFDYGCVQMTEYDGKLYVVTGHEGYVDSTYNQGHQGFFMVAVNEENMTGKIVSYNSSHSFAQYIKNDGKDIYVFEQSEGSRCSSLTKYNSDTIETDITNYEKNDISVFGYGGSHTSAWSIDCCATVDGLELSTSNILGLGSSIDQSKYDDSNSNNIYNIYLTITPKSNFSETATSVKWLTDYSTDGKYFNNLNITKINSNKFFVSWMESDETQDSIVDDTLSGSVLRYMFIDGNGNIIGSQYTANATISNCHPIVKNNKIVFYSSNNTMTNFYIIDSNTGVFSKKCYRSIGENVTWSYNNGVLTISGSGDMDLDSINYNNINKWKYIATDATKIVIKSGINNISDYAFKSFDNVSEIEIESGLKSIGTQAFAINTNLRKVTIPASVTSIGNDFIWTGHFWIGSGTHEVIATIYTTSGSTAEIYAWDNGIRCEHANPYNWIEKGGKNYCYLNGNIVTNNWVIGSDGEKRFVDMQGAMVTNIFKSDGEYTYFLQADGSPMKNKLTYHPNGVELIYFDENGHEVFNNFVYCKDVAYTCYFDTNGYMYKNQITFMGDNAYYLDGTGRLKQNGWFTFDDNGDRGYARSDGSLIINQFSYDEWGRAVFFHWNGMVARGLIFDGVTYYLMDETDGHYIGQFVQ